MCQLIHRALRPQFFSITFETGHTTSTASIVHTVSLKPGVPTPSSLRALVNRCKSGCPWTVWACTTTASYHLGDLAVALAIKLVTGGTRGAAFCGVRCAFIVGFGGCILLLFSAQSADTCSASAPSTASTTALTTPPGLLPFFLSVLVDHPIQLAESTAFLYLFGMFFFLKSPSLLIRFFLLPFRFRHRLLLFLLLGLLSLLFQPLPCCEASCSALEVCATFLLLPRLCIEQIVDFQVLSCHQNCMDIRCFGFSPRCRQLRFQRDYCREQRHA
ncbi:hypothetical protein DFH09DRAFT_1305816 [Mycena vulgaris]|nr:hypothetical protein DFH09DRAFT_1305816 [Mycena vulgaris]